MSSIRNAQYGEPSSNKQLKDVVDTEYATIRPKFKFPVLRNIILSERIPGQCDTAFFDFATTDIVISENFLAALHPYIPTQKVVRGILAHEIGHYVVYPKELAEFLVGQQTSLTVFGNAYGPSIHAYYMDAVDNTRLLFTEKFDEVFDMYNAMGKKALDNKRYAKVDQVMTHYYGRRFKKNFDLAKLSKKQQVALAEIEKIDFFYGNNQQNLSQYGTAIKPLLEEDLSVFGVIVMPGLGKPMNVRDFTDNDIHDALDKLIREQGKPFYKQILQEIEKQTGKKFGSRDQDPKPSGGAGIGNSEIEWNDDIAYYKRLCSGHGIYIRKKTMEKDKNDPYRSGKITFEVGMESKNISPFPTGGRILPGITQAHSVEHLDHPMQGEDLPDALVTIDSSGSMKNPKAGVSLAAVGGGVIALNYYGNNRKVGVINFSTNMLCLLPSRDMDDIFKYICAYYGGGTVLDHDKILDYLKKTGKKQKAGYEVNYEEVIASLEPHKRKEFEKKELHVKVDKNLKRVSERIDHHLITDGDIYNLEELINGVSVMAHNMRHTIYLIGNQRQYEAWCKLQKEEKLPNTQILNVKQREDLVGVTIGQTKKQILG